jgi:hypothetical protein
MIDAVFSCVVQCMSICAIAIRLREVTALD